MTPVHHDDSHAAIDIASLEFTYRNTRPPRRALDGLSLRIERGQSVALLGPNGSGKSTLLRIIGGLLPIQAGSMRVLGSGSMAEIRHNLGIVFQRESLDPRMTVWENLRDSAALYGCGAREARSNIDALLQQSGLSDRRGALVKTLSRGLARRVDLCRAMLHGPRLMLLDEPTSGLDPMARERFLQSLESARQQRGLTILMSTHLVDEADRQERVLLMHEGRVVADDSPPKLRARAGAVRVLVHDPRWSPADSTWRSSAAGFQLAMDEPGKAAAISSQLTAAGVPHSVAPPTLADAFELLTGSDLQGHAPSSFGPGSDDS